jgi:hypothetical protein
MLRRANKAKLAFKKTVANEPLDAAALRSAEQILARSVALAYIADHPDLLTAESEPQHGTPDLSFSAVLLRP